MRRKLFESHDLHIATAHLSRVGSGKCHREFRANVDSEHLQPGHTCGDRVRRQREHHASHSNAVRICDGGDDVDTLRESSEPCTLECPRGQPKSACVGGLERLPFKCVRYHGCSHEDTLKPPAAHSADQDPTCG